MMTTMYKWMVAGLLLCGSVFGETLSGDWGLCREKGLQSGLPEERVDGALEACRKNQLTATETETLLQPVIAAGEEELVAGCVLLKVEEGLAKRVPWKQIHSAAVQRLNCQRSAKHLVDESRLQSGGEQQRLIVRICMALESGLPSEVLSKVLNQPDGVRYGRLIHVVEAGESLQLEGLDASDIECIMLECLDRDLNRSEIRRVVNFVIEGHDADQTFEAIHAALWGASE